MAPPWASPKPTGSKPAPGRHSLAVVLSLCVVLFLFDGALSLADDSLRLFFQLPTLSGIRGTVFVFTLLMSVALYLLIGLAPMIPKKRFLPLAVFLPVASLVEIPLLIYAFEQNALISWSLSLAQVIFGLVLLYWFQGGPKAFWPLVPERSLGSRRFSWRHLCLFIAANVFAVLPIVAACLVGSAAFAINRFSEGFLALRPGGLTVEVRKYVNAEGKIIRLVPMAHVGEAEFYRALSQSFSTNATILMEGVSDDQSLLTNKITYTRMAKTLNVAEQQKVFRPRGKMVRADVDVSAFNTNTIDFLNMVTRVHAKGLDRETALMLFNYSEPEDFQADLLEDLLERRNEHVAEVIRAELPRARELIVPWGAAHMPGIARKIRELGFQVTERERHVAIRFGKDL